MSWIESHTVLIRHRKVIELAKDLRLKPVHVMGHLHALWHVALEQQEDGDLSSWSDEFIAESAQFLSDAPQFVSLLQKHGWLDGKILHDWLDYAGRYLESKYRSSNPVKLESIKAKHGKSKVKTDFSQTLVCPPTYQPNLTNKQTKEGDRLSDWKKIEAAYPNKASIKNGMRVFFECFTLEKESILKAIEIYKVHLKNNPWKKAMNIERFLNELDTWINHVEPENPKEEAKKTEGRSYDRDNQEFKQKLASWKKEQGVS